MRSVIISCILLPLCSCNPPAPQPYDGPIEGFIPEPKRKAICEQWERALERVDDEAEIAFPNASSSNSVVKQWKMVRIGLAATAIVEKHEITIEQLRNIVLEGQHKQWCHLSVLPTAVNTASARAWKEQEQSAAAAAKKSPEKKSVPDKSDAERERESHALRIEQEQLAKEKAEREAAAARKKAGREAAEAKERMEKEAKGLLSLAKSLFKDEDLGRRHLGIKKLEEIADKYPETAAGKEASELLKQAKK
jgi:hypothetical protein